MLEDRPAWQVKADLLKPAPGVGDVTAVTLRAELPELGSLNRTTWGERASVRSALYMAALSIVRTRKGPLAAFHPRLSTAGKPFKVALTAVMRKLLTALNARVRDQKSWGNHAVTA